MSQIVVHVSHFVLSRGFVMHRDLDTHMAAKIGCQPIFCLVSRHLRLSFANTRQFSLNKPNTN